MRRLLTILVSLIGLCNAQAQQYYGMGGLIHVPSADMDSTLSARIGAHYLHKEMIPESFILDGERYNSWSNYLSLTPFRWMEIGYGYTLLKEHKYNIKTAKTGFYSKDRYFSLRLQPVREQSWWPSIVFGGQDVWGSEDKGKSATNYYRNYYVAATKHVDLMQQHVGIHLAYRKWKNSNNDKWNGFVGGITLQPSFYKPLRLIGEYDGDGINVGADCTIFRHLTVQASLKNCKYFSAGAGLRIPLKRLND